LKRSLLFLSLSLGIFWFANYLQHHVHFNDINPKEVQQSIQQTLDDKGKEMGRALENFYDGKDFNEEIDTIKHEGISFLLFDKDDLKYWSNSSSAFEDALDSVKSGRSFFKLKNAWYLTEYLTKREETYIALFPIKTEYSIQNNYLVNSFNPRLNIPEGTELITAKVTKEPTFLNLKNETIFSLKLPMNGSRNNDDSALLWLLYLISLGCLIFFFYNIGIVLTGMFKTNVSLLIYCAAIIILRLISLNNKFPAILYTQRIFDPEYYASSTLLKSLGDFFVNVIIVFYLTLFLTKRWKNEGWIKIISSRKLYSILFISTSLFILFECAGLINYLFYGLIINSSISFNIGNIFELNSMSFYGFIIIGLLLTTFYLIADSLVKLFISLNISFIRLLIYVSSVLIITYIVNLRESRWDLPTASFAVAIFYCSYFIRMKRTNFFNYSSYLLIIFLFSSYSAIKIFTYNNQKEESLRIILASKIDKQRDYIAEHLYEDIDEKIKVDENIANFFLHAHKSDAELERIFHQSYFIGYWNRYDISIDEFNAKGKQLWDSLSDKNIQYYDSLLAAQGSQTLSPDLFFIYNSSGRTSYIARLMVMDSKNKNRKRSTLIIHINSKYVQEKSGFPELLITDVIPYSKDFTKYSYARYNNDSLVNQNGDFRYYLFASSFGNFKDEHAFIDKDKYNHLIYKVSNSSTIVMSKKKEGLIDYVTLFSYLFTLFCIFNLMVLAFRNYPEKFRKIQIDFNNRIQFSMLTLVALSLLIIGSGTIYYIIKKYNNQQYQQISDHITSLLVGIENEMNGERNKNASMNVDSLGGLPALYNNSNSDYNIYDLTGNLLYSTQPKIYKEGIISPKMNSDAFLNLNTKPRTEYIQNERIGSLEYIAAYVPIRNQSNKVIGYLNLPYFSKETELKNEISGFVVALINFYILLFALAIVMALFISNYITQPLRIIRNSISNIRLGKKNELILVSRKDEIGALVNEYNRMVNELAASAELLVKSERESAWREMAKQVAHEIKNPLTPMKLSIQHLERTWKNHPDKMQEMIEKTAKTLIEQIDSLSNIATEFANFAQMPKINNEVINLAEVIEGTCNLYKDTEGIKIIHSIYIPNIQEGIAPNLPLFGDKEQLSRAFSNLIKNGIQAIPEGEKGIINITISDNQDSYIVSISDNGSGIPEDKTDKIFNPNFTTKTTGMGLGLAIVKNSIESMRGSITFETTLGVGTTFIVKIPKYNKEN
jgi:two-component system nitrogen regulation sensor histidine kinase NtrY